MCNGVYALVGTWSQDVTTFSPDAPYFLNRSNNHVVCRDRFGKWVMAPKLEHVQSREWMHLAGVLFTTSRTAPSPFDPTLKWVSTIKYQFFDKKYDLKVEVVTKQAAEQEGKQGTDMLKKAGKTFRALFFSESHGRVEVRSANNKAVQISGFTTHQMNGVYFPVVSENIALFLSQKYMLRKC